MSKPTANYWVDVVIGLAFIVSGISGIVFLLPAGAGAGASLLGLSIRAWSDLHTYSSIVMIAGVGIHLVLHWKWIWHMTKRKALARVAVTSGTSRGEPEKHPSVAGAGASAIDHDRRAFLKLGGAATVATGILIAGFRLGAGGSSPGIGEAPAGGEGSSALPASNGAERAGGLSSAEVEAPAVGPELSDTTTLDGPTGAQAAPSAEIQAGPVTGSEPEQVQGVACRFGIVDDPYPGQCRHYVDSSGNGICDYSVLGSGNVTASGGRRGWGG